ncbi:hypothetical protein [Actinomycetospora straminea]|uniref:hypothetical protein n=1 Tax=Actinomycetospora straminea TaxID=663607 RepID=UPI00236723C3|nr:hypothetical protein [Actinomycetospora straminea]MDD7933737.1 hypothetical protein [Actinomycetospora straminea]
MDVLAVDEAVTRSTGSEGFGITDTGFVAKPYARLLAEKLATAQLVLGEGLDLTGGSVIRKLLEVCALEDARTWAALAAWYDDSFAVSATGSALDRLGVELGLPRPWEEAVGEVTLTLTATLPADVAVITIPRGARLLTAGGHHAALEETVAMSNASRQRIAAVRAFYPGPEHNLDPGNPTQKLDRWHPDDPSLAALVALEQTLGSAPIAIGHTLPLTGGELRWPDARYRDLVLRAPRSLWRADALELAVSLVPGVRQVTVRDSWGGLDLSEAVFGGFRFLERLFTTERDVASPFFVSVLVAPTPAALWDGPDGLRAAIEAEIEDLRPISIFPRIERVDEVGIGIAGAVTVEGLPLPSGTSDVVNASSLARALKVRLLGRVRRYVEALRFGEPVRWAEILHALMDEPGVADVTDLRLLRYPPGPEALELPAVPALGAPQVHALGENVVLSPTQVAVFVDDDARLRVR